MENWGLFLNTQLARLKNEFSTLQPAADVSLKSSYKSRVSQKSNNPRTQQVVEQLQKGLAEDG